MHRLIFPNSSKSKEREKKITTLNSFWFHKFHKSMGKLSTPKNGRLEKGENVESDLVARVSKLEEIVNKLISWTNFSLELLDAVEEGQHVEPFDGIPEHSKSNVGPHPKRSGVAKKSTGGLKKVHVQGVSTDDNIDDSREHELDNVDDNDDIEVKSEPVDLDFEYRDNYEEPQSEDEPLSNRDPLALDDEGGSSMRTRRSNKDKSFKHLDDDFDYEMEESEKDEEFDLDYVEDNEEESEIGDDKQEQTRESGNENKKRQRLNVTPKLKIISVSSTESLPNPYLSLGPNFTALQLSEKGIKLPCSRKKKAKYEGNKPWLYGDPPFNCDKAEDCKFSTNSKAAFSTHLRRHLRPDLLDRCKICQKIFNGPTALKLHINANHKDQRRQCQVCQGIFANQWCLNFHIEKVHEAKEEFVCEFCGRGFKRKAYLQEHVQLHSDPNFKPRAKKRSTGFIRPVKEKLDLDKVYETPPAVFCDKCGQKFSTQIMLNFHVRKKHMTEDEKKVTCEICKKEFRDLQFLNRHKIYIHTKELTYVCKHCGESFIYKSSYLKHEQMHSIPGWKPEPKVVPVSTQPQCPICHKKFALKRSINKHLKLHEKPGWKPKTNITRTENFHENSKVGQPSTSNSETENPSTETPTEAAS